MSNTTYSKAVEANMQHMGTHPSEWTACPFEMVMTDKGPMPHTTFPENTFGEPYHHAPTLYPAEYGTDGTTCELCGTPIKKVFHVQHDKNEWLMIVGSECVTHFCESTGEELAKQKAEEFGRTLLAELEHLNKHLYQDFWPYKMYSRVKKIIGNNCGYGMIVWYHGGITIFEPSSKAAISRWLKSKGKEALEVREKMHEAFSKQIASKQNHPLAYSLDNQSPIKSLKKVQESVGVS